MYPSNRNNNNYTGPCMGIQRVAENFPFALSLYHNCDSTAIRLRCDYDEKLTFIFCSRRMEAAARDAS